MEGRRKGSVNYRYGFNDKEKVNEIYGAGNAYDFGARLYDGRVGRWMSVDKYLAKYPDLSPYVFELNNPLVFSDPSGDTVIVKVTINKVGTTKINLFSSSEIKSNPELKGYTKIVPVYEVIVTNQYGCSATFYFTRIAYRGNKDQPDQEPTEVTFDVINDGDRFLGKIKDRWGQKDYVLELRNLENINDQTIEGMKGRSKIKRTAIQFHVKGASDGCLLCVGSSQFESIEEGVTIDETNLKSNSSDTQKNFISIIKDYVEWDKLIGKGEVIIVEFEKLYNESNEESTASGNSKNN
ncbi:MAG: hypothetical protein KatS3mg027_2671 [Bacteroidia bacterium]|nr:MAG: hypothetical protein KatS3mg027_2671 [Bacteroidia bacterium]